MLLKILPTTVFLSLWFPLQTIDLRFDDPSNTDLPHPKHIIQRYRCKCIERHISIADPQIPVDIARIDVAQRQKLICILEWTVLACDRSVRVEQRSQRTFLKVRLQIYRARGVGWGIEDGQLVGCASDDIAVDASGSPAAHHVSEGRDTPHEFPECWEGGWFLQDAREGEHEAEEQGCDGASGRSVRKGRDDHKREGRGVRVEDEGEGEHCEGRFEGVVHAEDGEVPGDVDEDGGDNLIGDLDEHVRQHKGDPGVGLAWTLTDFVQSALCDEPGHDLLHERGEDGKDHEDGEDGVLKACLRAVGLVEGEADEEGRSSAEAEFAEDILRCSPVLLVDAFENEGELGAQRHGVLA